MMEGRGSHPTTTSTCMMRFRKAVIAVLVVVLFVGLFPGLFLSSQRLDSPAVQEAKTIPATVSALFSSHHGGIVCKESPAYPLKHTNWTDDEWRSIPNFIQEEEITTSNNDHPTSALTIVAVCYFDKEIRFARHFPHAMQQLYLCWSWWQYQINKHGSSNSTTVQPVLQWPGPKYGKGNAFVEGILKLFQESPLKVQKVYERPRVTSTQRLVVAKVRRQIVAQGYALASPQDAHAMRQAASHVFQLPAAVPHCPTKPRINILNRRDTRKIINLDAVTTALQPLSANETVHVSYFEHLNLAEQVAFMMQTDILVSPHGAQLSSIPFLPSCAAVLEIFPTGYHVPFFFGSLAAASDVRHAYVYLGVNITEEVAWGSRDQKARSVTRKANMCPPVRPVYEAVLEMRAQWRQCCLALAEQERPV